MSNIEIKDRLYIDPFNEENWNFVDPDGTFLTWLKNNYFQEDNWKNILKINCLNSGLKSLVGLENIINLNYFYASDNKIENVEKTGHDKLISLTLRNNKLTNLSGSNFPNLKCIYVDQNQINTFCGIYAPLLEILSASNNKMTDLKSIGQFTNLINITLSRNELISLEGIENLLDIDGLFVDGNRLKNLKGIENLKKITYLDISRNLMSNLDGIENLTNLHHLYCADNEIEKISFENLLDIKSIEIFNNKLKDLDGIEDLKKLDHLDCRGNNFTEEYKKYLKEFCIGKNIKLYVEDEKILKKTLGGVVDETIQIMVEDV